MTAAALSRLDAPTISEVTYGPTPTGMPEASRASEAGPRRSIPGGGRLSRSPTNLFRPARLPDYQTPQTSMNDLIPHDLTPDDADRRVRPAEAGFTLVEIMVVVVILGLLATMVAVNVFGNVETARKTTASNDCKAIYDAAETYRIRNHRVPTLEDLTTPDESSGQAYLRTLNKDPWDNDYLIRELEHNNFEVVSFGQDRYEDTEDDIVYPPRRDEDN